jgi:hypothetical protein
LGFQLWGLDFHTRSFQDRNLKTFRTWFSRCGISILGPGFHTGGFTWSRIWNFFGTWFSGHGWGTKRLHSVQRSRAPTSIIKYHKVINYQNSCVVSFIWFLKSFVEFVIFAPSKMQWTHFFPKKIHLQ